MQEKVLILNASHNDERMIRALKELDFYVISTGNRPDLSGHKLCDEYIQADYSDKEKMLQISEEQHIDRICACCNDFGVKSAAYVAEKMGIPGYDPYYTVLTLHDKDRFKKFAEKNDIMTPKAVPFSNEHDALEYINIAQYPIIVKAVDLSAGNGIHKANNVQEAIKAVENAFTCSRSKRIVIEPFITGSQHGFCTYLINRKVAAYCSNNEYSFVNPYRVEIDTFPADDEDKVADTLIRQIEKMAELLNLCDGIFHLQYITDNAGVPHILECMRRIPGGLYTIPAESVSGINWDYWEVRAKCTDNLSDFPGLKLPHVNKGYFSYKCLMADRNGIYDRYDIPESIIHHIYEKWMLLHHGDTIDNFKSTPIGYLFTSYETQEEMKKILINDYSETEVCVQ